MRRKLVDIVIVTLLMATTIPAVGTINDISHVFASTLDAEWDMTFGGTGFDEFRSVQETTDGGYIACGRTDGNTVWAVKVDSHGNEEWEVTRPNDFGGIICGALNSVETSDGGYLLCTIYNDDADWYIGGLLKIDASGNIEWEQLYYNLDEPWSCTPRTAIELEDGYLTAGTIAYEPGIEDLGKDSDVTLIKTDFAGNLQWKQIYRYGGK